MHHYYQILSALPEGSYEDAVAYLKEELTYYFEDAYEARFDDAQIVNFRDHNDASYTTFFDCTEEPSPDFYSRTARVVLYWPDRGKIKANGMPAG